jgi:hypothetical protein
MRAGTVYGNVHTRRIRAAIRGQVQVVSTN